MEAIWVELVLIIVGVLANGFFAGSEIALVSSRMSRLVQLRDDGVRGAAIHRSASQAVPRGIPGTIQIAITMVGTLASAVGGATAIEALTPWLARPGRARARSLGGAGGARTGHPRDHVRVAGARGAGPEGSRAPGAGARGLRGGPPRRGDRSHVVMARQGAHRIDQRSTPRDRPGEDGGLALRVEKEVRYLVTEGASKGVFEKIEAELVHNVFEVHGHHCPRHPCPSGRDPRARHHDAPFRGAAPCSSHRPLPHPRVPGLDRRARGKWSR
jgi:hypothetical protein